MILENLPNLDPIVIEYISFIKEYIGKNYFSLGIIATIITWIVRKTRNKTDNKVWAKIKKFFGMKDFYKNEQK